MSHNPEIFDPLKFAFGKVLGKESVVRSVLEIKLLQVLQRRMAQKTGPLGVLEAIVLSLKRRVNP
jgi:hypothetical protein